MNLSDITLTIQTRIDICKLAALHKYLISKSIYPPKKATLLRLFIEQQVDSLGLEITSPSESFAYLEQVGIHTGSRPIKKATLLAIADDENGDVVDDNTVNKIMERI